MTAQMIEHRGIVQRVEAGKLIVVIETSGCESCGHGSSCGLGKIAGGRTATLLTLPANENLKAGDVVTIGLPQNRMTSVAVFGYLFPALAMLVGAGIGSSLDGSDGTTALGAIAGFLASLAIARIVIGLIPSLMPAPQLITLSSHSNLSQQEFHHERHNDH